MPRTIIWFTGRPTSGKTFQGDYLAMELGFHHVDGDKALIQPETKEEGEKLREFYYERVFKGLAYGEELWRPYYDLVCKQIVDEGLERAGVDLVVSLSNYRRDVREFCRETVLRRFKEAGEDVTFRFVHLIVQPEQFAERILTRYKDFCNIQGLEFANFWEKSVKKPPFTSFPDCLEVLKTDEMLVGYEDLLPTDETDYEIQTNTDHGGVLERVHQILNKPPPDLEKVRSKEFVEGIIAVQHERLRKAKEFLDEMLKEREAKNLRT
eukprot:TRINITY_DN43479_c0_g1_i1.p1 TRINITY_DN43479_c0_g1~~TRINITY_DN43479_c0_g1_i1.p1  ORF type:complete len:283 (+),score=71.94 TRINITY_DN43479_c0_g1_i1:53-850(+)